MTTWDEPYAWEALAQCWERAGNDGLAVVSDQLVGGLYASVRALFWGFYGVHKTPLCMIARLNRHRRPWNGKPVDYSWPYTEAGAKKRAEFCRRMAREARG